MSDSLAADLHSLPALCQDLRTHALPPGGGHSDDTRRSKPGSRPPMRLDVHDLLVDITTGLADHAQRHGRTTGGTIEQLCDWLAGWAATATHADQTTLEHDVQHWHSAALVAIGAKAPRVLLEQPCPHCGQQTLKVRVDRGQVDSAVRCTNRDCRAMEGDSQPPAWHRRDFAMLARMMDQTQRETGAE